MRPDPISSNETRPHFISTHFSRKAFYRMLGNVNDDRTVDNTDVSLITAAFGQRGSNLEQDVNGDGVVNNTDRTLASRRRGQSLAASLWLDD